MLLADVYPIPVWASLGFTVAVLAVVLIAALVPGRRRGFVAPVREAGAAHPDNPSPATDGPPVTAVSRR